MGKGYERRFDLAVLRLATLAVLRLAPLAVLRLGALGLATLAAVRLGIQKCSLGSTQVAGSFSRTTGTSSWILFPIERASRWLKISGGMRLEWFHSLGQ